MLRLLAQSRLERAQARAADGRAGPALARLRASAGQLATSGLTPPDEPGGFYHGYFCPDHAVELMFEPARPGAHACPVDGRVFAGEPYDSAWRWFVNHRLSVGAFELALLWRLDGDEEHRRRAAQILLGYAQRYGGYPVGTGRPQARGKATFQSLDEAVWLIPLARAHDLLRDALPAGQRRHIEQDLLRPAAAHVRRERLHRIHNIECWHNAALAAVGHGLDDADLVAAARDGEFGFHRQLADGVGADGLWWEGSSSYHFYALWALVAHAMVSEVADPGLRQAGRLREMIRAPVDLAAPDGRLPATNDCWFFSSLAGTVCHGVPPAAGFYEVAWAWYGDPAFAAVLARTYRTQPRDGVEALLYGADLPAAAAAPAARSLNLEPSGLVVLRTAAAPPEQGHLVLKYGPHGGGHGHPDKLALSLWAAGEPVSVDLGTPGYGIGLNQTWYRQTVSHNTVVVDGRSQPEAEGRLRRFDDGSEAQFAVADAEVAWAEGAYAGVQMRRTVLWREAYFLDLFRVRCAAPRQLDWVFRVRGRRAGAMAGAPHPEALVGDGYGHIAETCALEARSPLQLGWRWPGGGLDLYLPDADDAARILGTAPHNPSSERTDILLRRRQGQDALFVALFHPFRGDDPSVRRVAALPGAGPEALTLAVDIGSSREVWLLGATAWTESAVPGADRVYRYPL